MGYNDDFDGFDFDEQDDNSGNSQGQSSPADLRKAYNALKKQFKDQSAALEKATGQISQRNLRDVLADKGLRPGLARVIAKEDVDLTDSKAVEDWLSDPANQEDFAFTLAGATDGGANDGTDGASGENSDYAASLAQFQNAGNGAVSAKNGVEDQVRAQLKGAKTTAEINAVLEAAGKQLS